MKLGHLAAQRWVRGEDELHELFAAEDPRIRHRHRGIICLICGTELVADV